MDEYTGPERRVVNQERRASDEALLLLIPQIHEKIDRIEAALQKHMTDDSIKIAEEIKVLMDNAFPFGDPHGHRAAHEASIRRAEARTEFWKKMTFELSRWGLFGFLGWAAVNLWRVFVEGPK